MASAGADIRHAEYNLEERPTRIFQIWIIPNSQARSPARGSQPVRALCDACERLRYRQGALPSRVRARVLGAMLKPGEAVEYALGEGRYGRLAPASGEVEIV